MKSKVVVFGGGTGLSTLLRGLKNFPLDITAVVSVCDDGKSTGKLREEFNQPAVGDIRRVIISLSETEPLIEKMLDYRFETYSDLDGHTAGNLLLTAMINITGNMNEGIKALSKVLNLKGKVIPLTEDNVTLVAKMADGSKIEGEHKITNYKGQIENIFYKEKPTINHEVIEEIKKADYIMFSMGSLYTSIIPNLLCEEVVDAIDESSAILMHVCNIMTQPGETNNFMASDHIKILNDYLKKRKLDVAIINKDIISKELIKTYEKTNQEQVFYDSNSFKYFNMEVIEANLVLVENNHVRHDYNKLAAQIYLYIIERL